MTTGTIRSICGLAALLLLAAVVIAVPQPANALDRSRINRSLALDYALPRYQALADSTGALRNTADGYCNGNTGGIEAVRGAYHAAMDAWMAVQPVRFGPIELEKRSDRLAFWPDKHNTTGKQFTQAFAAQDPATIAAIAAGQGSVALQGFPALERLLFEGEPPRADASDPAAAYRCAMLVAVATNVATIAADTRGAWGGETDGFAQAIITAGAGNANFADDTEPTAAFLNGFMTILQIIADQKLLRPLGASAEAARPKQAESWRSSRSLRNIGLNLASLRALYDGDGKDRPGLGSALRLSVEANAMAAVIDGAFDDAAAAIAALSLPLEDAVSDPAARPTVERLRAAIKDLQRLAATHLAAALGVAIGFNSLDGD